MAEPRQHLQNLAKQKADMAAKTKQAGRPFKMGRNRPISTGLRLSLRRYILSKGLIPTPPASCDYSEQAAKSLSNVYENDSLGCCTISGVAHTIGILTGNADGGNPFVFTDQQIIALYSACGGYVPGDPSTDQGCDEVTVLNYWMNKGAPVGSNKILGYLSIDATDIQQVQVAQFLFESLYSGLELPDAWTNNMPQQSGFVWDVAGPPDPNEGHCVVSCGFNAQGVQICTWGMTGTMTYAAVKQYWGQADGGDLYVVISQESIAKASAKAPNGFDWAQLVADFDAMGGHVKQPDDPIDWNNLFAAKA
jgi:hypothetical protein